MVLVQLVSHHGRKAPFYVAQLSCVWGAFCGREKLVGTVILENIRIVKIGPKGKGYGDGVGGV